MRVLIPELPGPQHYYPMLLEMQRTGRWTNEAPMISRFEAAISDTVGKPCVAVANGTVAIQLALTIEALRGSRVLIPSMSFVGAAQAIRSAGMEPVICDVDPTTWSLTPEIAASLTPHFDVALPVNVFGILAPETWRDFEAQTGKPVVLDGGGTTIEQHIHVTTAFSLHATKCLGVGEGGIVACVNKRDAELIRSAASFGHHGTNAKMSGITAAVGISACDRHFLGRKVTKLVQLRSLYHQCLDDLPVSLGPECAPSTMVMPVMLPPGARASTIARRLEIDGIETKQWYHPFLHDRMEFNGCVRIGTLSATRDFGDRLLGLPLHTMMEPIDVRMICDTLKAAIG